MEYRDTYDMNGRIMRHSLPTGVNLAEEEYLKMVEAWIVNPRGEILVQRRSLNCIIYPGYWTLTTGHFQSGESAHDACVREVKEELGIDVSACPISTIMEISRTPEGHLLWELLLVEADFRTSECKFEPLEVAEAKWVAPDELRNMLKNDRMFYYPEICDVIEIVEKFPL